MNFFISDAVAGSVSQGSSYSIVFMLISFFCIFYFMIFRPQQKRAKMHKDLISIISVGDEIMTTGGLVGRVVKVTETGYLSIAFNEKNTIFIKRDFVAAVLPKGTIQSL